ncbi:PDC sensor domain-containing protein [Nitratidesulfovibrio termitidis]|uniref:PDC sensor domain-containing protein n=1 Tax=Nitratidesulfovibrio termitidis TaxID=42252 RepID=UPI000409979A|nr:PDC sensor domain-containing protein [Nitratidesulfovibrio termitidis]
MQRVNKAACLLLALGVLLATGCKHEAKEYWKDTRRYYREYLNTPAKLDLEDKGEVAPAEARLAEGFAGIDIQLRALERALENSDRKPDTAWAKQMFQRFPWISGLAAVDHDGNVMAQQPEASMKPLDFTPLLKEDAKQNMRALRSYVQDTPMGPEVYVGVPVYSGTDFRGLVIAHFDIRALLPYSSRPADLMIAAPGQVMWPGRFDAQATPIASTDWGAVLTKDVYGTVANTNGEFYWVSRYLGNLPLVFAVPEAGSFPEKPEQLGILKQAAALGSASNPNEPVTEIQPAYPELDESEGSILTKPAPQASDDQKVKEEAIR